MAKIAFSERAWAEYLYWQSERSPFEGIGEPEALVGSGVVIARQRRYTKFGKLMPLASATSAQSCQSASSLSRHSSCMLLLPS